MTGWTRILTTVSLGRMGLSLIPLSYYSVGHCCYALAGIWAWSGLDFREGNKAQSLWAEIIAMGRVFPNQSLSLLATGFQGIASHQSLHGCLPRAAIRVLVLLEPHV